MDHAEISLTQGKFLLDMPISCRVCFRRSVPSTSDTRAISNVPDCCPRLFVRALNDDPASNQKLTAKLSRLFVPSVFPAVGGMSTTTSYRANCAVRATVVTLNVVNGEENHLPRSLGPVLRQCFCRVRFRVESQRCTFSRQRSNAFAPIDFSAEIASASDTGNDGTREINRITRHVRLA